MRPEFNSFFIYFSQRRQAVNLKTAAVCKYRAAPVDEFMEPANLMNYLMTRPQIQMVCIAQYDFRAYLFQFLRRHCLDSPLRANRHECRGINETTTGLYHACSGIIVNISEIKYH
jgi:hypothetical protein